MSIVGSSAAGPFQVLLQEAVTLTGATKAILYREDPASAGVILVDCLATDGDPCPGWLPTGAGLIAKCLASDTIVCSDDVQADPAVAYPTLAGSIGRSMVCLPIRGGGRAGVLVLAHPDPAHFSVADQGWPREFVERATTALRASRLWSQAEESPVQGLFSVAQEVLDSERRQREINEELHAIAQRITAAETLDEALSAVVTAVTRIFGAASASIYLLSDGGQIGPRRYTTRHTGSPHWDEHVRVRPNGMTMTVLRTDQSLVIEDTEKDPRTSGLSKKDQRTVAVIPLRHGGKTVGVLYANWSRRCSLTRADVGLFETLAAYGAISVDGARLREHERDARQQAEAEHERLQDFLKTVAHDLRGPLTLLVAYSELLNQGSLSDRYDATQQALPALENAARRVQRLVNDLIDLSRITGGDFNVQRSSVDLGDVVRDVAAQLQATTDVHDIHVSGPCHLIGQWDPARLRDLLTHLVRNAIHYTPDGGTIRVDYGGIDDEVNISVSDAGIGIPPEQRDRIFQPFSRVDSLPTTKERGLGLYIAKAIVDAHQGRIWVESELGRGSTFHVALPVGSAASAAPA